VPGCELKPFEQIVAEHGQTILRVCRAVVGPNDAEDAWSETFLSALRAYPDLPSGTNVEAWLVTIAKRKAIDQHRARARNPVPVEKLPEVAAPVREQPGSAELELWEALKELPTKQREAVAYHFIAGMPYAQIAKILGNSEAAARRAAADGIKKFRFAYKGEHR
jgi:RNA polymerase sigma factor (sigma-70 family)